MKALWLWFQTHFRKLMPFFLILTFALVGGFTDIFGLGVQETIKTTATEMAAQLKPMAAKLLLAIFMLYVSWFMYSPFVGTVERILCRSGASARGKDLGIKLTKVLFWTFTLFLVFTFAAQDFFGKFVVGVGAFSAALLLALQGVANDFICGLLIQFTKKVNEGELVTLDGVVVKGTIKNVGLLSTIIDSSDATVHVPNREVWAKAVKVLKPEPTKPLIILPPGVDR